MNDPDIERLRALAAETQSAAARILAERDRYRETMLRCAEKLETLGNNEPLVVAAILRSEAGKR